MKWARTPGEWERRDKLLALFLAAATATAGLLAFLGGTAISIALGVIILLIALGRLGIAIRQTHTEDTREREELDRRLRVPISSIREVIPKKVGVDPAAQDVLPGGEIPQYLPRATDQQVRDAVEGALDGNDRWIIALCGPSKVGKSRTLYEALRWCEEQGRDIHLAAPKDGDAVRSLLGQGKLPKTTGTFVVWLDDLENFVAEGVTLESLEEWHENANVIVVATFGGKGSERQRQTSEDGLSILADTLLQHSVQIALGTTSQAELEELPDGVPAPIRREIERHGLAAVMVAAPALERKLTTGRHGMGEPESTYGVAVVKAAIDWARCGRTDPISLDDLRRLWSGYLPAATAAADQDFESGLAWALRPVSGTISLLKENGGFLPYDYIVSFVKGRVDAPVPLDEAWQCALSTVDPLKAVGVGVTAASYDRDDDAMTGMQIAAKSTDKRIAGIAYFNLGVLLKDRGDEADAEAAFRQADERGDGSGANNLGALLENRGDMAGAEAAYRRADERGSGAGASNLGALLKDDGGDEAGAEAAFRRADERGSGAGAFNLGLTLENRGDMAGAEAAYRRADERGDADGASNLGGLLKDRGDEAGAEAAFRRADEMGHGGGTSNLGVLLVERGDEAGAEAAFRRADEREHRSGAVNLGLLLRKRGDEAGAEAAFRRADERGDADGAFNLGLMLDNRGDMAGAEAAYRRADERGDAGGASNLGVLLAKRGDEAGAEAAFRRAGEDGAFNLGVLLAKRGDIPSARVALQRAADLGPPDTAEQARGLLAKLRDQPG